MPFVNTGFNIDSVIEWMNENIFLLSIATFMNEKN